MTVRIPLTRGLFALIDDADLPLVQHYKWRANPRGHGSDGFYAVTGNTRADGGVVQMHHVIFGSVTRLDHRDGDGLNNRRSNLRAATASQNGINRAFVNATGFRGVHRHGNKWRAQAAVNGCLRRSAVFATPEEAARAYDALAVQMHGEFAVLNFPRATPLTGAATPTGQIASLPGRGMGGLA